MIATEYNRNRAMQYSNQWALHRNDQYLDFSNLGGDCTNFISQCLYAGSGIMDYTKDFGWYYINGYEKSPSWTGVPYLYKYLTRTIPSPGPYAIETNIENIQPADIIQLAFSTNSDFRHSLFISSCGAIPTIYNIYVNTHTDDQQFYSLTQFNWNRIRFIKIQGVYR